MWLALVLLAQPAVPESPAALSAQLLACATTATDPAERRACWLAWASLGAGDAPAELPAEGRAALAWRDETGGLALFVTWLDAPRRLRVGVRDPAGLVLRVELVSTGSGPPARLHAERKGDRWEAQIEAEGPALHVLALGAGDRVLAHLTAATDAGPPLVAPTGRAPAAPAPALGEGAAGLSTGVWIAALVLGVLLVGGGVFEELRR